MNDISHVNTQLMTRVEPIFAISLLAIALIIYINRLQIKQAWLNFRTRYCLSNLGLEQLTNIKCPEHLEHDFTIERLLLRHNGLTLIIYKKYPGRIFSSENIAEWTQMLGLKSYPFKNPLFELNYQIKAISACLDGIPVNGYLFFDHTAEFPKGMPNQVMTPDKVPPELQLNNRHQVETRVMAAWKMLQQQAAAK